VKPRAASRQAIFTGHFGLTTSPAVMTFVVPLGKLALEFFEKDRDVIHALAIAIKQALELIGSIWLLSKTNQFLLNGVTP
jgi:hypothetical protein